MLAGGRQAETTMLEGGRGKNTLSYPILGFAVLLELLSLRATYIIGQQQIA